MSIKSIILLLYALFLLLFIGAYISNPDSLIIDDIGFLFGVLFFFLAILYTYSLNGSFSILLTVSFVFLILYAQRLVNLMFLTASSSNSIYLRYDFLTSDDVNLAIIFLDILLGTLILIHFFLKPKKSVTMAFGSEMRSLSVRQFIHKFYSVILVSTIVYRVLAYDPIISKAWPDSALIKILIYLLEYSHVFLFFTLAVLYSGAVKIGGLERRQIKRNIILFICSVIVTLSKSMFIVFVIILMSAYLMYGKKSVSLKYLFVFTMISLLTILTILVQSKVERYISTGDMGPDNSMIEDKNIFLEGLSLMSRRLGGVDWIALSFSQAHGAELSKEVTFINSSKRIINRFFNGESKPFSVLNDGRIIPEIIRGMPKWTEARYAEYMTLNGKLVSMIGWGGIAGFVFIYGIALAIIRSRITAPIKNYLLYSILFTYVFTGDSPELVKAFMFSIIYYLAVIRLLIAVISTKKRSVKFCK